MKTYKGLRSSAALTLFALLATTNLAWATTINVQAYGATGNGQTDDTAAIDKAIAAIPASGATLYFPCGTYIVSETLTPIMISNVTVAGATGCTTIKKSANNGYSTLQVGEPLLSASTPLLAVSPELTNTISANFTNLGGLQSGDYIFLEQGTDTAHTCSISGCRGEILQIQSVSGNTATVTTAVHHAYDPALYAAWVKKLKTPVSGVSIHDLTLDGSGVADAGLYLVDMVNSSISNMTVQNFAREGVIAKLGYSLSWNQIVLTHTGTTNVASLYIYQQGKLNVSNVSLSNLNPGSFGLAPQEESDGTFLNISIDSAGTGLGRPFKLNASVYNTFNNLTVRHSEGTGYNGLSLLYYSSHNTFNGCIVQNNHQNGIMGFGFPNGYSQYNTFNNCTVSGNTVYQVALLDTNDYWTFNGGTYTSVTNQYNMGFFGSVGINGYYVHNVTFNGPGVYGIYLLGNNNCLNNNTFQGFHSDVSLSGRGNLGQGNKTPDGASGLNSGTCPTTAITPVITSALTAGGTVGSPFSYRITATNEPTTFSASGLPSGLSLNTGTGLILGTPKASGTNTVTLGASNSDGTGAATLDVAISSTVPAPPVINSFTAAPVSIPSGQSSTLSWNVTGASSLSISPTVGAVSGTSVSVTPSATTVFTLTATNALGSTTAKATVTVAIALPTITSFTASPVSIASGGSSTLSWNVSGASSLSIGPNVGTVAGTSVAVSPSATTTYTLTASNSSGSVSQQLQVAVSGSGLLVNVQKYGATGNGSTDDTAAINNAIGAIPTSGAALYFPCGTYLVSSQLRAITTSNVTITGPVGSSNCATLAATGTGSFSIFYVWSGGLSASQRLASDAVLGSSQFTTTSGGLSAVGIAAGDYAMVGDSLNAPEVVKITSVSGNTASIEGTFSYTFPVSNSSYVQKLIEPADNLHITYLNFDGSRNTAQNPANGTLAMRVDFATNSEVGYVTVSNFLGTGASGGTMFDTGYHNTVHDYASQSAGNGGQSGYTALGFLRQSYDTVKNVHLYESSGQNVSSLGITMFHFGLLDTIYIDAGQANGSVFRLARASHNTINNLTTLNGAGGDNGISVTAFSQYNTFNSCVSEYNSITGIRMYGDQNIRNTFNNCTVLYNQVQFAQGSDSSGNYGDAYTTISGGKFGCTRNQPVETSQILQMSSANFVMSGVTVYDDDGLALEGLSLGAGFGNANITNNTFSNFSSGRDIFAFGSNPNSVFCGNQTPDGNTPANLASTQCGASRAPMITSGTTAFGTVGTELSYQITATTSPTSFSASGLPSGLSIDAGTGLISGIPASAGINTVTLRAANSDQNATATLTLTVHGTLAGLN